MKLTLRYSFSLLWLCYLLVAALLLFARGFLLNRTILKFRATCGQVDKEFEVNAEKQLSDSIEKEKIDSEGSSRACPPSNVKVILLLVNGLRFDFISPNGNESSLPYKGKLSIITELLQEENAQIYKFIADPPTTTMQQINGLMTGSFPTFGDIGSYFATSEIHEDNLIDQLVHHNKNIIFLGDDTWPKMFPGRFLRSFSYPSLNVWDIETVDSSIKSNLIPSLKTKDWNFLIAHFHGVGLYRHHYGPNHPEMDKKLTEMNDIIMSVVNEIDNDTIVIVAGDHGIADNGGHGGDSDDEEASALIFYSQKKTLRTNFRHSDTVRKRDLTPTLANMLGVPTPFSNLGTVILSALPIDQDNMELKSNLKYLSSVIFSNVVQVTVYIQKYVQSSNNTKFTLTSLSEILDSFQILKLKYNNLNNENDINIFINEARSYLKDVIEISEDLWVQFDSILMMRGLILMFLTLALLFIFVSMPSKQIKLIFECRTDLWAYFWMFLTGIGTYILYVYEIISHFELSFYFFTCTTSIMFIALTISLMWFLDPDWYNNIKDSDFIGMVSRVFILLTTLALFSNSLIIEECTVTSFVLISIIWISAAEMKPDSFLSYSVFFSSIRGKILSILISFSLLVRLSWYYWTCRGEQLSNFDNNITSSLCVITIIIFASFVTIIRFYLRSLGNLIRCSSITTLFVSRFQISPTIGVVCCGCYWIVQLIPSNVKTKLFLPSHLQLFPQIVLVLSILSIFLLFCCPINEASLELYLQSRNGNLLALHGWPTAYSAAFINLGVLMSLIAAILLGESRALATIILMICLIILSVATSVIRYNRSSLDGNLFIVPWWTVFTWGLSSIYFFYGTGHQTTFPEIQWDSAKLLGDTESTVLPGILVLANTFISQIIHALLLPMIFIIPFTLNIIWPKAVSHSYNKRAELILCDKQDLSGTEVFLLSVKYILFFGFRVFITMFAACIHARDTMAWKIFVPKFMFESFSFLVTLPGVILSFILFRRITSKLQENAMIKMKGT